MIRGIREIAWVLSCSAALSLGACGDDGGGDGGETEGAADTSADGAESADGEGGTSAAEAGEESTGAPEPKADGEMCEEDSECISEKCFIAGALGGVCGECLVDADCEGGGCSIPNPLSSPPQGSACNMGELGAGCMSGDICQEGLDCAEIINVPGFIVASTCSECVADADCGEQLCSPNIRVMDLSGDKTCVDVGSLADGDSCDFEGSGNEACTNFCEVATVMGVLDLGVCSPCDVETDEGCAEGETCEAPVVDLAAGLVAGSCVADE